MSFTSLREAVEVLLKGSDSPRKFTETIELIIAFKKQSAKTKAKNKNKSSKLSGKSYIFLPHNIGREKNIGLLLASNDQKLEEDARSAGAAFAGGPDLIEKLSQKKSKFKVDVCLASTKDSVAMKKYASKLGPKGLMPSQRDGTVSDDPISLIEDFKKRAVLFSLNKYHLQVPISRMGSSPELVEENALAFVRHLLDKIGLMKTDFASFFIKSTMGKPIKFSPQLVLEKL